MVAIINGTRVTAPRPDLNVPSPDPNTRLTVINNTKLVTEEERSEQSSQRKIANFRPVKLKEFSNAKRLELVRIKQRKGDINEVEFRVKKAIVELKQQNLKGSRFSGEIGKGSLFDIIS